jgi:hypothetical protein
LLQVWWRKTKLAKKVKIRQATIEDLPEIIRVEKEA